MLLTLAREILKPDLSHGSMYVDGRYECYTLEDTDRGLSDEMSVEEILAKKIYGETAIPYGTYKIIINHSQRFRRLMPRLVNVKGYDGIIIHYGNTVADTAGCPLVGAIREDSSVMASKYAYNNLFPLIRYGVDHGGCWIKVMRAV